MRFGLLVMLVAVLAGCTPNYNWREVTVADGAVKAFFPDRPLAQQRPLTYSGHEVPFSLATATVDKAVFAVAYAPLPEALRQNQEQARRFALSVVGSLHRNLGVAEPVELPKEGVPFVIEGASPQGRVRMQVIVWLTAHALIEGIVTADQATFPQQQAAQFLQSLEVVR